MASCGLSGVRVQVGDGVLEDPLVEVSVTADGRATRARFLLRGSTDLRGTIVAHKAERLRPRRPWPPLIRS